MTDQRPQYGEIATPEEQRRAAGLPPIPEVAPASAVPSPPQSRPDAPAARPRVPVDRFATVALLAYGLVNVIMTGLSYLDFATAMNQVMTVLGIDGEFTNYSQGRIWGTIAAFVLAVGWSVTAYLAIRRLRRGKLAWWVPVAGAVVTIVIASICVAIPMMSDPAFVAYLNGAVPQ